MLFLYIQKQRKWQSFLADVWCSCDSPIGYLHDLGYPLVRTANVITYVYVRVWIPSDKVQTRVEQCVSVATLLHWRKGFSTLRHQRHSWDPRSSQKRHKISQFDNRRASFLSTFKRNFKKILSHFDTRKNRSDLHGLEIGRSPRQ